MTPLYLHVPPPALPHTLILRAITTDTAHRTACCSVGTPTVLWFPPRHHLLHNLSSAVLSSPWTGSKTWLGFPPLSNQVAPPINQALRQHQVARARVQEAHFAAWFWAVDPAYSILYLACQIRTYTFIHFVSKDLVRGLCLHADATVGLFRHQLIMAWPYVAGSEACDM